MKRSAREGSWAELPSARVRFALEAAFLILVATGAALAGLRPLAIILLMAGAWLLVALVERASSLRPPEALTDSSGDELPTAFVEGPVPAVPEQEAYRWLFWRRARARLEELPSPTASLEERPARAHVRRIEPEPASVAAPSPEPEPAVEPELQPAATGPAVTTRPLDLPGLEESPGPAPASSPPPRPRFASLRQRVPERPSAPPPPPPAPPPREWNLWDLERRAREQAGNGPRDEEWSALFTHLRGFANADGVLPKEFDGLVRESFGTLIEAA